MVGFDKVKKEQSQMRGLRTVSVRNMVGGRGEGADDLIAELPTLRDLDLSESLISSWSEVSTLCNQLQLHTLDLSYNLLPVNTLATIERQMKILKHLVVGHMFYTGYTTWTDILTLAPYLPSLSVLQILNNFISSFPPTLFSSLTELDLDGNNLSSWSDIEQLSQLTHLRLNGIKLSRHINSCRQL